jgi:hypothetical protein
VRLTTAQRKTLLLRNLNRGGQGPIWAVAQSDGWSTVAMAPGSVMKGALAHFNQKLKTSVRVDVGYFLCCLKYDKQHVFSIRLCQ